MRRYLTYAVVLLVVFAAVPSIASAPRCTIRGTPHTDFLTGTEQRDVICGRGGNDYISGAGGRDRLRGGADNDTIVGGNRHDRLSGRGGNDKLFAVDGHPGDVVDGGAGKDQCYGEKHDHFRRCEIVRHSNSPRYPRALALAMSRALGNTIRVAQKLLCGTGAVVICLQKGESS